MRSIPIIVACLLGAGSAARAGEPLQIRFELSPLPAFLVFLETARGAAQARLDPARPWLVE